MPCTEMTVETAPIQVPRTLTAGGTYFSGFDDIMQEAIEAVAGTRTYRVIKAATGPSEVIPHQKGR